MWMPDKNDFHDVNCRGTEIMLAAAQKRGVARFLHCSTESILFHPKRSGETAAEETLLPAHAMPGAYTRSKALAEQRAMQAAAAGFPVVIGTPTMPIGAHDHNLTPPTTMLRHFLDRRLHLYLDFIVNLVDVRDAASGLILAMERGRIGQRYVLAAKVSGCKAFSGLSERSAVAGIFPCRSPAGSPRSPQPCSNSSPTM